MYTLPRGFRRPWLAAIVLSGTAVVAGLIYAFSASAPASAQPKPSAKPAQLDFSSNDVLRATPRPSARTISLSGLLNPVNQIQLNGTLEGRVSEVHVRAGDEVAAGQVLARFDEADLRARIAERSAALASAEEQMRVAERSRNSNRTLLEQNFISKNAFDNTLGGYADRRATVDAQRAQLAILQRSLRDAKIVAPFAGAVASRLVEPGQWVEPNRKLFTLVDLRQLEIEASLPSQHLAQLAVGQRVHFRTEGYGDKSFEGKVVRINPSVQAGTRSVLAYVAVANPDKQLRAGLFVSGEIEIGAPEEQIRLPATAVQLKPNARGVWVVHSGKLAWQPVEFERISADEVKITRGLKGGEQVIAMQLKGASAGQAVRIVPAA
jgi:RND family efflux transporter MFP subunit